MEVLHTIKYRVEDELKDLYEKKAWTKDDVYVLGKLIDVMKDIETVSAMKRSEKTSWVDENGFEHNTK